MAYSNVKSVIFDLDGTVYFGSRQLALGANEVIQYARSKYEHVFFATNNSFLSRRQVYERLVKLGIELSCEEVLNSTYLIAQYLTIRHFKRVWCLGGEGLCEDIRAVGIEPLSDEPQAMVVGYNPNFCLSELEVAINHYRAGCPIIAANRERTYPRDGAIITPGAGAVVAAFLWTVQRDDVVVLGKPSPLMLTTIADKLSLQPYEILMIGDTFESDIMMANNFGAQSILVTNGKDVRQNCDKVKSFRELLEVL